MDEGQTQTTNADGQQTAQAAQTANEPNANANAQAQHSDTDWKAEARKWEARAKENKAKADAYDEAQEAAKSDLQKAQESAQKWKTQYDELKAESDRKDAITAAAKEYGVDVEMLSRMVGDVEENAKFLKEQADKSSKYPSVNDTGAAAHTGNATTAQLFADTVGKIL